MSQAIAEKNLEALKIELETAHAYLEDAIEGGDPFEIAGCREDVTMLAKEVAENSISRPFTAFEDQFGDYPL